jgi:predicted DNA-binding ribbon-helix-helix protein
MSDPAVTIYTLQYTKADLDNAPAEDRFFFLMASSLANDAQMLNKTMKIILDTDDVDAPLIVKQGNSAFAMMILRMTSGRLTEGWKLLSQFSKILKRDYEPAMSGESKDALKEVRAYFNPKGGLSLLQSIRDSVAFHSLKEMVEQSYASLDSNMELGDYLSRNIGNTLYYTAELLHYESLRHLAKIDDQSKALGAAMDDAINQTANFNSAIFGFVRIFCERYLKRSLERLQNESETIGVRRFDELKLPYFSALPGSVS